MFWFSIKLQIFLCCYFGCFCRCSHCLSFHFYRSPLLTLGCFFLNKRAMACYRYTVNKTPHAFICHEKSEIRNGCAGYFIMCRFCTLNTTQHSHNKAVGFFSERRISKRSTNIYRKCAEGWQEQDKIDERKLNWKSLIIEWQTPSF